METAVLIDDSITWLKVAREGPVSNRSTGSIELENWTQKNGENENLVITNEVNNWKLRNLFVTSEPPFLAQEDHSKSTHSQQQEVQI